MIRGNARSLPLPDESVDLIITSPPYFSLRAYQDGGKRYPGQVGAESTWQQYIHGLLDCTEEWIRVLKPTGSIFVNLGDKYSSGTGGTRNQGFNERSGNASGARVQERSQIRSAPLRSFPPKSLLLLPERYRIAAVDRFGLIARAVIVWSKPNGLPESVTDRVRRSHEDWVHLVKQSRYFAAVDEIREPYAQRYADRVAAYGGRDRDALPERHYASGDRRDSADAKGILGLNRNGALDPLGKLPGSVWTVPTEPLRIPIDLGIDHFAAFPSEWPRRLILGWSPAGICTACGEGRRPTVTVLRRPRDHRAVGSVGRRGDTGTDELHRGPVIWTERTVTGYACTCTPYTNHPGAGGGNRPKVGPWREYHVDDWTPPPTRPAVVLDPFGGTGTVALVAAELGRVGITVDLSQDYCRLAAWRTTDPKQRERVRRKIKERSR